MKLAVGLLVLIGAGLFVCWPRESVAPVVAPGEPARPDELAGPGYLPTGAPLRAPAAPPPRGGARTLEFDLLRSFDYDAEVDILPDEIEALDGQLVELVGVMYYAVEDPARVRHFYLMPNHYICCFGRPRANDAVEVELKPGLATPYLLNYFLVRGRIEVGAVRNDAGRVLCLFRIPDAEVEVLE